MTKDNYLNRLKGLPESLKQLSGLILITVIIILSFGVLNIFCVFKLSFFLDLVFNLNGFFSKVA